MAGSILVLGANGHAGHAAMAGFAAAGWDVTGFGRDNRKPVAGTRFVIGDAADAEAVRAAAREAGVVFNGLNLAYDKWFGGAAEGQLGTVLDALEGSGKILLFPGNIYNYAASERVIAPGTAQHPQTERGAIRVRMERRLAAVAATGDVQVLILRAGDFFGAGVSGWFDQIILREAGKGKVALPTRRDVRHAWAYLPDLANAFVALAERRAELGAFETFHFAGHAVTGARLLAAIERAAGRRLRVVDVPWRMLGLAGFAVPLLREVVKMRYLWDNEMVLEDARLDAMIGAGTDFDAAIAETVGTMFSRVAG